MIPRFISVPTFDIYDEDTGKWAEPEHWWLEGECKYQSNLLGEDGEPLKVIVPDGYPTDLASIPKLFRMLFIKNGKHRAAAVVHDFLCGKSYVKDYRSPSEAFPRRLADKVFLEAMKVCGVKRWKRYPMYWAVRSNTERLILIGKARKTRKAK